MKGSKRQRDKSSFRNRGGVCYVHKYNKKIKRSKCHENYYISILWQQYMEVT